MDITQRLQDFIESEGKSCYMDIGGITPEYVYRSWGGSVAIEETKSEVQVRLKELHVTDKNAVKGRISKFELFLLSEGKELSDSITFLRNLQELRSSTTAHRKSRNKKSPCEDYFKMGSRSQQEVLEVIFNKGIEMLEAVNGVFVK